MRSRGPNAAVGPFAVTSTYSHDAVGHVGAICKYACAAMVEGEDVRQLLAELCTVVRVADSATIHFVILSDHYPIGHTAGRRSRAQRGSWSEYIGTLSNKD